MKLITINKNYELLLKDTISNYLSPNYIYLPIDKHSSLKVDPKDVIYKENLIFDNVYSPVSGKILGVKNCSTINNKESKSLLIENDYREKFQTKKIARKSLNKLTKEEFLQEIKSYDEVLFNKLENNNEYLYINSIEHEPYVANYIYINKTYTKDLLEMIDFINSIMNYKSTTIIFKETDFESINNYNLCLGMYPDLNVKYIPDKYLIDRKEYLTKYLNIKDNFSYIDIQDVFDCVTYIKKKKCKDEVFITITGTGINNPQVVFCKIGTLVKELVNELVEINSDNVIYIGNGLLSGKIIDINSLIVTKDLKSLFIMKEENIKPLECINCGKCNDICPVGINIHGILKGKVCDKKDCINCGLCNYICPSYINIKKEINGDSNE